MDFIKWPFLKQSWGMEVVRSEGPYLYTKEGQKILDAAGGAIVSNIGYGRDEVAEAVKEATKKDIDRRDISVPEIHGVGKYKVQIKLHNEVNAEINLEVTSY